MPGFHSAVPVIIISHLMPCKAPLPFCLPKDYVSFLNYAAKIRIFDLVSSSVRYSSLSAQKFQGLIRAPNLEIYKTHSSVARMKNVLFWSGLNEGSKRHLSCCSWLLSILSVYLIEGVFIPL